MWDPQAMGRTLGGRPSRGVNVDSERGEVRKQHLLGVPLAQAQPGLRGEGGQGQCWGGRVGGTHRDGGEPGSLQRAAAGSCLRPPHFPAQTAAGDLGLQTMWRISGQGCGMDRILFISREGPNNGATAASVGLWPDLLGDSGKPQSRPRKRRHRKEGIRRLKGMKPAASSRVRSPSSESGRSAPICVWCAPTRAEQD